MWKCQIFQLESDENVWNTEISDMGSKENDEDMK
jgi:hypothetical protein